MSVYGISPPQDLAMDGFHAFLEILKRKDLAENNFLGMLNVVIGRRIAAGRGVVISKGLTWRELASWLKKVRWPKDGALELGLDPKSLPPRDRERFWYTVIARANVDSEKATAAGNRLVEAIRAAGLEYHVGPPPGEMRDEEKGDEG
jgi:hypothetical protein